MDNTITLTINRLDVQLFIAYVESYIFKLNDKIKRENNPKTVQYLTQNIATQKELLQKLKGSIGYP